MRPVIGAAAECETYNVLDSSSKAIPRTVSVPTRAASGATAASLKESAQRTYSRPSRGLKPLVRQRKPLKHSGMAGQGSTGNVIAALCSFFIPGLGQLIQGRLLMAIIMFVLAAVLWIVFLGWLIHLWSIIDAAMFKP
jgi:TM2 domain-containing membrane protein YozV